MEDVPPRDPSEPQPSPAPSPAPSDVTALYDAHAGLVWKHLHRLGVRTADVPDLLQEVFLVVHRRWDEVRRDVPIEPFLWGISAGLAANYRRRAFRKLEVLGTETDTRASDDDPERALDRSRTRARIEAALDTLSPEARAVFVMFELEALSGAEIARLLGVPIGTVHSRLHGARRDLQRALAGLSPNTPDDTPKEGRRST